MKPASFLACLFLLSSSMAAPQSRWTLFDTEHTGLTCDTVFDYCVDMTGTHWFATEKGLVRFDGLKWDTYTFLDGLAGDECLGLAVDKHNHLWIASTNGLTHYDGSVFTPYKRNNSDIPFDYVQCVHVDNRNRIWIGGATTAGVGVWDGTAWTHYAGAPHYPYYIVDIASDGTGITWLASSSYGLCRIDVDGTWTRYTSTNSGLPDDMLGSIAVGRGDTLWIGTYSAGLVALDGAGGWKVFTTANSAIPSDYAGAVCVDPDGGVWVGSPVRTGVSRRYEGMWTVYTDLSTGLPLGSITRIRNGLNGRVWVTTSRRGAMVCDPNWAVYRTYNSDIPGNTVLSIAEDRSGDIWVGCDVSYPADGLGRLRDTTWATYSLTDFGIHGTSDIDAIAVDSSDTKWFGTYLGIVRYRGDSDWELVDTTNADLPSLVIQALHVENSGRVWVGTRQGASVYDGAEWTRYDTSNTPVVLFSISDIAFDGATALFGLTQGGIATFDGTTWTQYHGGNSSIPDNDVTSIAAIEAGEWWMGTYGRGLMSGGDGSWDTYRAPRAVLDDIVRESMFDRLGNHWYGTDSSGVGVFRDGRTVAAYTRATSPLPHNGVNTIFADSRNRIWIGTDGGLASLEPVCDAPYYGYTKVYICQGDSLLHGGRYWKAGQWYADHMTAHNGCDSTVVVDIQDTTIEGNTISVTEDTLWAEAEGVGYQWYDCLAGEAVDGAIGRFFVPSDGGRYAVIATASCCVDTSACIDVDITHRLGHTAVEALTFGWRLSRRTLHIRVPHGHDALLEACDLGGRRLALRRLMAGTTTVGLTDIARGVRIVRLLVGGKPVLSKAVIAPGVR
ncbi:MAG: hypothetical protein GF331_24280 [Chitinivibrionales bacterium]|nr:hypothetical protein [Chitinivibrionales bacterium]